MTKRRAAIYLRQSLDRTGEGLAVARQRADCRKLAAARGWQVVDEYEDNDTSASGRKPRPEYRRLLADVRAGRVDAIVAWAPDRLTRRPIEVEELVDLVESSGCLLATVSGEVDLSTPYGRAVARIFGAIARQEVEQKGARQARANLQRAEAGQTSFTRRPFGYTADGTALVEAEADEIRRAADAVLAGTSLASLVTALNARRVPTSTGGRWTVTTLRRILLNPRYAGQATYKGRITAPGAWPAVFDVDTHQRLVLTLTNPARLKHNGNGHKYLMSGLVRCGRCGDPMFAGPMSTRGGSYRWMVYKCRKTHLARRLDLIDEVIEAAVIGRLARPDAADLLADDGTDLATLRAEAQQVRQQLDDLAALFAEGAVTAEGLRKASARLRERLEEVERRCTSTGAEGRILAPLVTAEDVAEAWRGLPLQQQRAVVDLLLEATILPAGKGARFSAEQVQITWRS